MALNYRFKSNLLGKQVLQVSHGPQEIDSTVESELITITVWYDADRYEAEALLNKNAMRSTWNPSRYRK